MAKMIMSQDDKDVVVDRYSSRFQKYGYSPKTLGWDKGKQDLRYQMLFREFSLEGKSILDIGCGFGDANKVIITQATHYRYFGVDIVDKLIHTANDLYKNDDRANFEVGDFLAMEFDTQYDIIVASGVFNFKLLEESNYQFIEAFMEKAFGMASEGIAFDFLSDKVDYQYAHTFHSSPSRILEMAYGFSRNVMLNNSYMPFEFNVTVFKDDTFDPGDTIFTRYKHERGDY